MTQEIEKSKKSTLEAFLKQRAKRQSSSVIEARRLVNLYRQLPLFGADFLEKYNQMLLEATPEVQTALSDIIGGAIVRQYHDFLQGKAKKTDDNSLSDDEAADAYQYRHEESYLPSADDVAPFGFVGAGIPSVESVSNHSVPSDSQGLVAQVGLFERALERQAEFLLHALEKVQTNIVQATKENETSSALIAELATLQQTQKETLAELLSRQNEQAQVNIDMILAQTKDLTVRQMEMVEKLLGTNKQSAPYAVIEEENVLQEASSSEEEMVTAPKPVRTYTPSETPVFKAPEVELEPMAENGDYTAQETSEHDVATDYSVSGTN